MRNEVSIVDNLGVLERAAKASTKVHLMITYKKDIGQWRLSLTKPSSRYFHTREWVEHEDFETLLGLGVAKLK